MIKTGDKVNVNDGSYSIKITNKGISTSSGDKYNSGKPRKVYTVILSGCEFPPTGSRTKTFNNTVIQNDETGEVTFIEERFLQLKEYTLIIDNKTIKLSAESYENLKKQLI